MADRSVASRPAPAPMDAFTLRCDACSGSLLTPDELADPDLVDDAIADARDDAGLICTACRRSIFKFLETALPQAEVLLVPVPVATQKPRSRKRVR